MTDLQAFLLGFVCVSAGWALAVLTGDVCRLCHKRR